MKKILSLLLVLVLAAGCTAASAAGYTLPEKMERQLQVGSGLKGSFIIRANADAELCPLVYAIQNAAFEIRGIQSEGDLHYYIYQAGENEAMSALTEICTVNGKSYLRSDFFEDIYALPSVDSLINAWFKSDSGENPSVFPDLLRMMLKGAEDDGMTTDTLERQLEVWINAFSTDSSVVTEDGAPRLTQTFKIPVEEMYNFTAEIVRILGSNENTLSWFRDFLSQEQTDVYLNPNLGYYYIDAMKQLDLEGNIEFSRTVSTLGELIENSMVLPLDPGRTGYRTAVFRNNEEKKSITFTGPRGTLYLELPAEFDMNAENLENQEIRFVLVDNNTDGQSKNVALKILLDKKGEKTEAAEDGRIYERETWKMALERDTGSLPEGVTEDMIPDMAPADAELEIHYTSKTQLSSPTTLEVRCKVKQGRFDFDLEGQVKTSSPWVFSPFSIDNAKESLKTLEDLQGLTDEWAKAAKEKLNRSADEGATAEDAEAVEGAEAEHAEAAEGATAEDAEAEPIGEGETKEDSGVPEIQETESDAEAEPVDEGETTDDEGTTEETEEYEHLG